MDIINIKQIALQIIIKNLVELISDAGLEKSRKDVYIKKISNMNIEIWEQACLTTEKKISSMDMKYIICFSIEMNAKDISILFNVEPASVRTARYRIRKKLENKDTFGFLF